MKRVWQTIAGLAILTLLIISIKSTEALKEAKEENFLLKKKLHQLEKKKLHY